MGPRDTKPLKGGGWKSLQVFHSLNEVNPEGFWRINNMYMVIRCLRVGTNVGVQQRKPVNKNC